MAVCISSRSELAASKAGAVCLSTALDLVRLDFSKEFVHLHTLLPFIGTTLERATLVSLGLIFTEVIVNLTNSWVFGIGKLVSADETLLFVQRC